MSQLQRTPIYRVLHRPNLLLGGERELVLFTLLVTGGVVVTSMNLTAAIVCGAVWLGVIGLLRRAAKADPAMSKVYMRYLRYQSYYPARSRPFRKK